MSIGCVHTPWDLPSCLTSPVVPGELILPHWAQNILVHVKEVGPSPWRTWSGMAAGTEHFGTVELLAICYSGSDSIISAKDPPPEFQRPSSIRSAVSFCVYKDYRLCHLQSQTVTEAMLWPSFGFIFCSLYWGCIWELVRAGQICRMLLSCQESFSACDTTTVMQVWECFRHRVPDSSKLQQPASPCSTTDSFGLQWTLVKWPRSGHDSSLVTFATRVVPW